MDELRASLPEDLGDIEEHTTHLKPLKRKAQFAMFMGDGARTLIQGTTKGELVRANRSYLRDYLAQHATIHWDKRADRIEEHGNKVTVYFRDGTSATGDLVVGADGVHSVGMQKEPFKT